MLQMNCKFCDFTLMRGKAQNNFRFGYKSKKILTWHVNVISIRKRTEEVYRFGKVNM